MSRAYELVGERKEREFGGWQQQVRVGDRLYVAGIYPNKRVRIPFKPRGQNMGWTYLGFVRSADSGPRFDETFTAPGSLGVRGLLTDAGLITSESHGEKCNCRRCHGRRWTERLAAENAAKPEPTS